MKYMLKSKKAISLILATLLIIVIVVAAAIITYAWITTFITSTTKSAGVWLVHEATSWNTASPYYMYYGSPGAGSPPAFWSDSMGADAPSKVYRAGDDFEEHAVGDTPDGWTVTLRDGAGTLTVEQGASKVMNFNASAYVEPYIHGGSISWTDYVYKIRMRRVEVVNHQGIVFRFSDADNTVYAGVKENGTQIQCWKRINSTWIHLASYTIINATDTWHTWEVRLKGQDFDLYWNGDLLGSLSLSPDELTSGKVGCFAGYGPTRTHYDNATVRKYVKPEPSTSLSAEEANHWWDLNYSYRKQISIHNNLASTLHSDYSVSVTIDTSSLVSAGKMLPDGNDLRIGYWNGTSWGQLNRHTMKMNTDSTQVWFKTQATFDANSSDNSKIAQMLVYVRNRGTEDAQIDKMYVGISATNLMEVSEFSIAYNPETRMVNAGKTIRITVTYDWVAGRRYYFKVATRAGQLLEFNLKAPVTQ